MAPFHFCETYLLHIRPFVVNKSTISPFLGGGGRDSFQERASRIRRYSHNEVRVTWVYVCVCVL